MAIFALPFMWPTTINLALHCDRYAVVYLPIEYLECTWKSKIPFYK
jgi:hypothetical protein